MARNATAPVHPLLHGFRTVDGPTRLLADLRAINSTGDALPAFNIYLIDLLQKTTDAQSLAQPGQPSVGITLAAPVVGTSGAFAAHFRGSDMSNLLLNAVRELLDLLRRPHFARAARSTPSLSPLEHRTQRLRRLQLRFRRIRAAQVSVPEEVAVFENQVDVSLLLHVALLKHWQQAEAAGHVHGLRVALASVHEIERRRSALIHQAVHDIGSNVFGVKVAAKFLGDTSLAEAKRVEFASLLKHGVEGVSAMLGELMELARLEAGQERREVSTFDATELVTGVCEINGPVAYERGLFLNLDGPHELTVDGDPGKVRRLLQNLVVNALKYTRQGGVSVSWGEEKENWWLMVKDTGSGLAAGSAAPMAVGLQEATASARESDEKTAASEGDTSQVLTPARDDTAPVAPDHSQHGEGIGLSIVKRLCELLDASLEMVSSAETGTTFRVVLPRSYAIP